MIILGVLLAGDAVWLALMAQRFYRVYIGYIMNDQFNYIYAALFYGMYAMVIYYLALKPGLEHNSICLARFNGCLLGLAAYGAYNLTNHATLRGWPLIVTIVDTLWGTTITGAVSYISFLIISKVL
jgi:uncharacterized membrane protein